MDETNLPVTICRRMGFSLKRGGKLGKVERYHGPGQPGARMRPEPFV
jgi:hypothetical protein